MNWQTIDPQAAVPNTEQMLTISQVRAQTGLTARTIRYYEEVGLLPGVRRRAGGRRVYGPDEVERLGFITRLKAMGLALGEIKDLNAVYAIGGSTHDMLRHLDEQLSRHARDIEERVRSLEDLQEEIRSYRAHVAARLGGTRAEPAQ